uniref:G10 protein n=1 Tax=Chenopodium quinoa TaxID=63459 RepID=A0A803MP70_CHEQI
MQRWASKDTLLNLADLIPPIDIQNYLVKDMWDGNIGWKFELFAPYLPADTLAEIVALELIEDDDAIDGIYWNAQMDSHDGKRKCETLWPVFKIAHQKSRYIYDLYYRSEISKELYEFCLDQGYADRNLIAKWKKQGYERLCCLRCIQPRDHNFGTTCVCQVPKHLREEKVVECVHCGCRGCASGD